MKKSPRSYNHSLHDTMDAQRWTKEFVRLHGGDEGLMLGWFANAIMVGYDKGRETRRGTK